MSKRLVSNIIMALFFVIGISYIFLREPSMEEAISYEINGILIGVDVDRGTSIIKIKGDKIFKIPYSFNDKLTPKSLGQFLQLGDSIVKRPNEDTLYIYRGQQRYYFLIGDLD